MRSKFLWLMVINQINQILKVSVTICKKEHSLLRFNHWLRIFNY